MCALCVPHVCLVCASCVPHVCLMCASCVPCVCLMCASCVPHVCLVCASCVPHVCLMCASCVPHVRMSRVCFDCMSLVWLSNSCSSVVIRSSMSISSPFLNTTMYPKSAGQSDGFILPHPPLPCSSGFKCSLDFMHIRTYIDQRADPSCHLSHLPPKMFSSISPLVPDSIACITPFCKTHTDLNRLSVAAVRVCMVLLVDCTTYVTAPDNVMSYSLRTTTSATNVATTTATTVVRVLLKTG